MGFCIINKSVLEDFILLFIFISLVWGRDHWAIEQLLLPLILQKMLHIWVKADICMGGIALKMANHNLVNTPLGLNSQSVKSDFFGWWKLTLRAEFSDRVLISSCCGQKQSLAWMERSLAYKTGSFSHVQLFSFSSWAAYLFNCKQWICLHKHVLLHSKHLT